MQTPDFMFVILVFLVRENAPWKLRENALPLMGAFSRNRKIFKNEMLCILMASLARLTHITTSRSKIFMVRDCSMQCASLPRQLRKNAPVQECPVGQTGAICTIFTTSKSIRDSSEIIIGPNIDPQGYDRDKCRENCFTHFYGRREFAENARDCPTWRYW